MGDAPATNVLSSESLSNLIIASLPSHANPKLKVGCDAIAVAAHATMLTVGFRLVGLDEDHRIEAPTQSATAEAPAQLPLEWNAQPGSYAFRYRHTQSSMEFLLKINRMGPKAVIMGMGLGDDRTCSFDCKISEFVSDGNLPLSLPQDAADKQEMERRLAHVFISVGRLSDFGSMMRVQLIQKLIPSLQKEGYEESSSASQVSQTAPGREANDRPRRDPTQDVRDPPARPHPLHDPLVQPAMPRRPLPEPMPGFEDEFGFQQPPRGGIGGVGFPRLGDRDRYPQGLGPHDPLRSGIGPGYGGGFGGGGMHPTFDDPLFAGQGPRGGLYNPQAPPGSRYDPTGPGMGGQHPRGAGMGGRPPNPFGGFGGDDFI